MNIEEFGNVPEPRGLRERSRGLALLESICNTERRSDVHRFTHDETAHRGLILSHYRDETGNYYTIVFGSDGVIIYGFDCDYGPDPSPPAEWLLDSALEQAPVSIVSMLPEPTGLANFCLWWSDGDIGWNCSSTHVVREDGEAVAVLWPLVSDDLESLRTHVFEEYFDTKLPRDPTIGLLSGQAVSATLIRALNARIDARSVLISARQMGATIAPPSSIDAVHKVSDSAMVDAVIRRDHKQFSGVMRTQRLLIDAPDGSGRTAVHWSVVMRETAMLAALLAAGADPNRDDNFGVTPLALVRREDRAVAQLLIAAGANPETDGRSARPRPTPALNDDLALVNQVAQGNPTDSR